MDFEGHSLSLPQEKDSYQLYEKETFDDSKSYSSEMAQTFFFLSSLLLLYPHTTLVPKLVKTGADYFKLTA